MTAKCSPLQPPQREQTLVSLFNDGAGLGHYHNRFGGVSQLIGQVSDAGPGSTDESQRWHLKKKVDFQI